MSKISLFVRHYRDVFGRFWLIFVVLGVIGNITTEITAETVGEDPRPVSLRISKNFEPLPNIEAQRLTLQASIKPGESVARIMKRLVPVETSFGGEFITRIFNEPQANERELGWFYYVNGVMANVGAGSYQLRPGGTILWDLHSISPSRSIGAIVGSFPQPFRGVDLGHGETKHLRTVIEHGTNSLEHGRLVKQVLNKAGVDEARLSLGQLRDFDQHFPPNGDPHYRITVGNWLELAPHFAGLGEDDARRLGLFVKFNQPCELEALSWERTALRRSRSAVIFVALAAAFGTVPQFLITSCDTQSITDFLAALLAQPDILQGRAGVWFEDGKAFGLPYVSEQREIG